MYGNHSVPFYVAPYIREYKKGLSNEPKGQADQIDALKSVVQDPFDFDYEWVNRFGIRKGTYEEQENAEQYKQYSTHRVNITKKHF